MKEIIVKTQKEFDAISKDFDGYIYVEGGTYLNPIVIKTSFEEANLIIRGEAYAVLWDSSHAELRGSSHAVLRDSSHAVLRGSSHAVLRESSHAKLFGEAMVSAFSAKEIICKGYNVVSLKKSNQKNVNIVCNKDSYVKVTPDFEPTFKNFKKVYPIEVKDKKAIFYKAVHKRDGKYVSDYSNNFTYEIGEIKEEECASQESGSCSRGLHIAHKSWARSYGISWNDFALLECEVEIKHVIVCEDTDGKARCSKLKVLREVPANEYY